MRWLTCIVVLLLSVRAHADEASDREEARRAFEAGQAADRQRDWQSAIDYYLRANDLVPHSNTIYNIATNYERLGKLREAGKWYQKYLEAAPDSADRERVGRQLRELKARAGTITVRSVPNGARVTIDGKLEGATPYSDHIKGGPHKIVVELDGMRDERAIDVQFGEPAIVDVTLRAQPGARAGPTGGQPGSTRGPPGPTGTLRVVGSPLGALITVDALPAGQVPAALSLAPGVHRVRVSEYGFAVFEVSATVEPNREVIVEAQLASAPDALDKTGPSKIGYLFGLGGGVDVRGDGELLLFEIGARTPAWDASVRIGKTVGFTAVDLMVRWTLLPAKRLTPFLAGGYTVLRGDGEATNDGAGYLLSGGVRFDFVRGEHVTMSLVGETGVRLIRVEGGRMMEGNDGYIVPFMTSLQLQYR